jgi:Ca2+-binding RTX toxin-like protein
MKRARSHIGVVLGAGTGVLAALGLMLSGSVSTANVSHVGWPIGDALWIGPNSGATLIGTYGNDLLLGGAGSDTIYGGPGNDVLWGDQHPSPNGPNQTDVMYGGTGNNWLYTSHGHNIVYTGPGKNNVFAFYGHGTVYCGAGDDTVHVQNPGFNHYKTVGCKHVVRWYG